MGREKEIKTKVSTVAYWSEVPEETGGDDVFIFELQLYSLSYSGQKHFLQ